MRQKLEGLSKTGATVGERVKAALQLKRLEGETALDRVLSGNGEKALDLLLGAGPKVAITAFALRGVGNAAEMATEHIKKLREGSEGVGEAILKIGESIPIFGEAVKAGAGLGKLFNALSGIEEPEEALKRAQDRDEQIRLRGAELRKQLDDNVRRHRLVSLEGDAKAEQEIKDRYTDLGATREQKRVEEEKQRAEQAAQNVRDGFADRLQALQAAMRSSGGAGGGAAGIQYAKLSGEMEQAAAEAAAKARQQVSARYNDEEKRDAKDQATEIARYRRDIVKRAVDDFTRSSETGARNIRREIQAKSLEDEGLEYYAKRVRLETEYQQRVQEIAQRAADTRKAHPEYTSRINAAAVDEERAAKEKLDDDLRRDDRDTSRARIEKLRREGQETQDIRDQTRIKLLSISRQADAAELEQLKVAYLNQREDVQRERDKQLADLVNDWDERVRVTKAAGEKLAALGGKYAADVAAAKQAQGDRREDRTFSIDEQVRQARLDSLRSAAEYGDAAAAKEAGKLEILDKQLGVHQRIAQQLRDETSETNRQKLEALGALTDVAAETALKRLQLAGRAGSAPLSFGFSEQGALTGVEGRWGNGNGIKETDTDRAIRRLPDAITKLETAIDDWARAVVQQTQSQADNSFNWP